MIYEYKFGLILFVVIVYNIKSENKSDEYS